MPIGEPLQLPENHSMTAPVPSVPPLTVNVVLLPLQIIVVPEISVGATDSVLNEIIAASVVVSPLHADVKTAR